jgi:hypothetical protein
VVLVVPLPDIPLPVAQPVPAQFPPTNARNQGRLEESVSVIVNVKAVPEGLLLTLIVWNVALLLRVTELLLTVICAIALPATSSPANKMEIVRLGTEIASIESSVTDDNTS